MMTIDSDTLHWSGTTSIFDHITDLDLITYLIFVSVVSRAFMAGVASQTGDADFSRAPGLTSGLQGSVNVHRGALL